MRYVLPLFLLLGACATPATIIKEVPVEVKVPVTVPCVQNKPAEVQPVKQKLTREQWNHLTTDQREKLLGAQSLNRKAYGDSLNVATAGCR